MKLNIFNWGIFKKSFPKVSFTKQILKLSLEKIFSVYNISDLSIIFVTSEEIRRLNREYREVDSVTDVLSFEIDREPFSGEVYICPEYISLNYSFEEILRDIIHGVLHLLGYDHTGKFEEGNVSPEEMFVKQENILQNILDEINSRAR